MVARENDLEEKRVYVLTPMIQEPIFSLPVVAAPTTPEVMVPATVVKLPVVTMSEYMEPVLQEPIELIVAHEEELHQSQKKCQ